MSNLESHRPDCDDELNLGDAACPGCGEGQSPAGDSVQSLASDDAVPWGAGGITLALLLFLVILIATAFLVRELGGLYPAEEVAFETWVFAHMLAAGTLAILWFTGLRNASSPARALGLRAPSIGWIKAAALALAALAFSIGMTFLYTVLVDLLGLDGLRPSRVDEDVIFSGAGILLSLQALALITPLSEEVLFRGFVLRGLLNHMGPGPSVVATALVFSVLHLDTGTVIPIFFTGLALGWLQVRTGSLWPCVAAHAGQNALVLILVRAGV